jgi:hypothetical protein
MFVPLMNLAALQDACIAEQGAIKIPHKLGDCISQACGQGLKFSNIPLVLRRLKAEEMALKQTS